MRAALLALIALVGLSASAGAVPEPAPLAGRIVGVVTDALTGETLIGASVRIEGTSIGAATNVEGQFSIPNAPSGPQQLLVSYVGYKTDTLTVEVPNGGVLEIEVALESATFDEVVVTAQVAGQLAAINEQFRDPTVGNVVSRDRIQELPDNNAAESIGRLPGVSIQRSGGEANRVAIRGLSPKYNNVTVNGVRLPSTNGDDRAVDLSLVSSNVLDGIDVRKAITPDMDADAIGGTVNLRLRNAPRGLSVDLLAQGGYTGLQEELGNYKFVGTVSDRFLGDRIGVIATANAERYDRSADKLGIGYAPISSTTADSTLLRVDNVNAREETVTRSRTGGSLLLDYALPGGRLTGNAFYNSLDNDALYRSQYAASNALNYQVEDVRNETSILTSALGAEQDLGWLKYDGSVSFTRSRSDSPANRVFSFAREANGFTVLSDSLAVIDPLDVGSRIKVDSTIVLSSLYQESVRLDDDQVAVQLNLQTPFRVGEWLTGYLKTGGKLRWLDRTFNADRSGRQGLNNPNAVLFACLAEALPQYADRLAGGSIPISDLVRDYDRGDGFLDGRFGLGVVADEEQLAAILQGLQSGACASETDDPYAGQYLPDALASLGRDYSGTEAYQAGYVMGRFDVGRHVTVIPGVRYERDESDYQGQRFRAFQNGLTPAPPQDFEGLEARRDNAYWLPMLHVDVRPVDWLSLRLARTETLARPGYSQYAPISSIDVYSTIIQASNSLLRPSQATNYDASVQVVRGNLGLVGVSAFHKTIDDLILQVQYPTAGEIGVPEGTNVPVAWYRPSPVDNRDPVLQTFVNNDEPTTFYGFELEWQTNFSYLPGALKGLVLNANYTRSFSEGTYSYFDANRQLVCNPRPCVENATLVETTRTGRMPDQAAHIGNVTLGYDFRGFSTRLSYIFQSNTTSYINTQEPLLDTFVGDYSRFDLAVSQKLGARFGTGLEVFANLNNLNSRPDQVYTGQNPALAGTGFSERSPTYRELYGFTADAGIRFRY